MKIYRIILVSLFGLLIHSAVFANYNVKDFGAKGDDKTIDSPAINRAIEAASQAGGGTVFFPAGTYLSYSIRLSNNIHLYLDEGAVLKAARPSAEEGYDPAEPNPHDAYQDFGHSHWQNSLIWGIGLKNIRISGFGTIYGYGLSREESLLPGAANKAIALKECINVDIQDITMIRCGHFALLATGVENLGIRGVKIDTNRDGLDIDACRNVRISDCTVNAPWDDAIVLKASYALGYYKDTENVYISNCMVSGYDQGSMIDGSYQTDEPQAPDQDFTTGRIKFGTESSGGFRNITISNCVFDRCRGLALETVDGGIMEDIVISNITMRNIVNPAIFLRLGARMRSPQGRAVGSMRRISISKLNCFNIDSRFACILISGIPQAKIEEVSISDVRIVQRGGGNKEWAGIEPPERERSYPEPSMFGYLPSSTLFLRHVNKLTIRNLDVSFIEADPRPALYLQDVHNSSFHNLNIPLAEGQESSIQKEVSGLVFTAD